jgi:hypothetical protein
MSDLSYEGNKAHESVNTTVIETNGFVLTEINEIRIIDMAITYTLKL